MVKREYFQIHQLGIRGGQCDALADEPNRPWSDLIGGGIHETFTAGCKETCLKPRHQCPYRIVVVNYFLMMLSTYWWLDEPPYEKVFPLILHMASMQP